MSPKRFFVIGGYTFANPGDEAILKTTLFRLERLFPGSRFIIWSDKEFALRLSPSISYEVFAHKCPGFFSAKSRALQTLGGLYRRTHPVASRLLRLLAPGGGIIRKMREADHILFLGGGYLNSLYNLLQMHHLFCLAKESGKPVYLLGQTIGPFFRSQDREIAQAMYRGAERVVVREESSKAELGIFDDKIVVGGDDALCFADHLRLEDYEALCAKYFGPRAPGEFRLGLNLRPSKNGEEYYRPLVESLDRFNRECVGGGLKVLFVPMETSVYCDDRYEGEKLRPLVNGRFPYMILRENCAVEDRLAMVAKTDMFVGMRFHSLVFATARAVPCLALYQGDYYLRKVQGLFDIYDLPRRYCLPLSRVRELTDALRTIYQNSEKIRAHLREKHVEILTNQDKLYRELFSTPPAASSVNS